MSKHRIVAGLALCLMLLAGIGRVACACDMEDISSTGHHHQAAAHHGNSHSAMPQDHRHPGAPCPHGCLDAKAIKAAPGVDGAVALSSPGFFTPLAIISQALDITFDAPEAQPLKPRWQTGPPYLKRTPVQLHTVMLN